jgi:putative transposase
MNTLNSAVARVLKRLDYPLDVMLSCVRWYVAYRLSLRHLEQMMAERGIAVDHSTVHRWAMKLLPVLEKAFRCRKRSAPDGAIRVKGLTPPLYVVGCILAR